MEINPRSIKWLLSLFLVICLVIPVIFLFTFDLQYYFIPEFEFRQFYLFAFLYSIISLILAGILSKLYRGSEISRIPEWFRIILGILWVVDGALQFQPEMPYGFLSVVLMPSIQAIPFNSLQSFVLIAYRAWEIAPIQFDAMSGALQIFIGVSFLINKSSKALRITAYISILWATLIWIFGEGFGGVPEPGVSVLIGFPGSSLIYVLMAIPFVSDRFNNPHFLKMFMKYSIVAIIISASIIQLLPGNTYWTSGQLAYTIYQNINMEGEPNNLAILLTISYRSLLFHEWVLNVFFSLLLIISAGLITMEFRRGVFFVFGFVLAIWVIFQDMGIYILPSTDPNTGLPLAIFILLYGLVISLSREHQSKSIVEDNKGRQPLAQNYERKLQ